MKRNLLIFLFINILIGAFLIYRMTNLKDGPQIDSSEIPFLTFSKEITFHPDSVLEVSWLTYGHSLQLKRPSRKSSWTGTSNQQSVQERLNYLASIKTSPLEKKDNTGFITISLKFDNSQTWSLSTDGKILYWLSGPKAGEGGRIRDEHQQLFLTGKNTFQSKLVSWCPRRPIEFRFQKSSLKWIKSKWNSQIEGQPSRVANGNLIENWVGKYCQLKVQNLLDNDIVTKDFTNKTQFYFSPKYFVEVSWEKNGMVRIGNEKEDTFYNPSLIKDLEELSKMVEI